MRRDETYLLDILIAARRALQFCAALTPHDFEESDLHQFAVVKALEIIGEASVKVSEQTREEHPDIPWREMAGMRNVLIHEYSRIDVGKVWETVQIDLPKLITSISPLVPPEP